MEFLISFYDNALIYYPNFFFAALFLLSILVIVLIIKEIIYFNRELKKIIKKIKNDINKINVNGIRISKLSIEKNLSLANVIKKLLLKRVIKSLKTILKIIKIIFIMTNVALQYLQLKMEKIFKKIGKEILIEE